MIPDSKYEDKAFLISELCEMFKADELSQLVDVEKSCPAGMSCEEFKRQYLKHLELLYLKNFRAIQQGKYEKIPFQNLNTQIVKAIQSPGKGKEYPLMPRSDKANAASADTEQLRSKLQSLKNSSKNL
jgi:hypothetical protein